MENNPKEIDNKHELIAYIVKTLLDFLKQNYWKLILVILSLSAILVPLIFLQDLIKLIVGGK